MARINYPWPFSGAGTHNESALMKLKVLYIDNHLLTVLKPAGILSQGDRTGDHSMLEICKSYIKNKFDKPGAVFLGLVHRLDRPVSGVMLFARTSKAASRMAKQFRERSTEKIYLAATEGRPPQDEGALIHYLDKRKRPARVLVFSEKKAESRKAELNYKLLGTKNDRSLLQIKLITGVKHQIRAQLAKIDCPIIGDYKYDFRKPPAKTEKLYSGRAIALHAYKLTISHPTTKEKLTFKAPLPPYWPEDLCLDV